MMKRTPHTPGPWKVDPSNIGTKWNIGTDEVDVALASQLIGDGLTQPARSANARLIAAAPDLLEALKSCAAALRLMGTEFSSPYFTDRHGDGPRMLDLAQRAAAVIAKAEGQ